MPLFDSQEQSIDVHPFYSARLGLSPELSSWLSPRVGNTHFSTVNDLSATDLYSFSDVFYFIDSFIEIASGRLASPADEAALAETQWGGLQTTVEELYVTELDYATSAD